MTMNLPPEPDRILTARLWGTAQRHASAWWSGKQELTEAGHDAAVAELRALAAGRADLLAEVAGLLEGCSEGGLYELRDAMAAQLLRDAGADPDAIPRWVAVGRQRREQAHRNRPLPM